MSLSVLTPEAQLLFLAAGDATNDAAIRKLLVRDLDWVEVCRLAERERSAPILWRRLKSIATDRIPLPAEAHLKKLARVTSFHMSYLEGLVIGSTSALDRARIDYTLLKGAALGCAVYGSFSERPMVDVDLLVRECDGNAAVEALLSAGWLRQGDKARDGNSLHHHHLPPLIDPNGLVSAEVHTSLFPRAAPFGITTDALLRSPNVITFRGSKVRVPNALYLLLHACIHFAWSHLFRTGGWRTFRDVRTMTDHCEIDWNAFVELAGAHRAGSCCYWTLRLARNMVGARVPDEVLAALRPSQPAVVLRALERHFALIMVPSSAACPSVSLRRVMWIAGILPDRSGHGASRPWEVFVPHRQSHPDGEGVGKLLIRESPRKEKSNWARYWASVLLAAPTNR